MRQINDSCINKCTANIYIKITAGAALQCLADKLFNHTVEICFKWYSLFKIKEGQPAKVIII
jgi:hypothetical protein